MNHHHGGAMAAAVRASATSKADVRALAVTKFSHEEFVVVICRGPVFPPGRPARTPVIAGDLDQAGSAAGSTLLNPVLSAYEESLQTSGCPAAAEYSRSDTSDGQSPRRAAVSRRVSPPAVDGPGMAPGGAGLGAQTRARRFLNGDADSPRPRLHCSATPLPGDGFESEGCS